MSVIVIDFAASFVVDEISALLNILIILLHILILFRTHIAGGVWIDSVAIVPT